jgi:TM2 domain-containing membrane protein YozV
MNENQTNPPADDARPAPLPPEPPPAGAAPPPPEPPVDVSPPPPPPEEVPVQAPPVSGAPPPAAAHGFAASELQNKKLIAGVLGIVLGGLGVHKFYLGYQQEGIIMLLITVVGGGVGGSLSCGLLAPLLVVMPIVGLIEGILYLTKSDQEFEATYLTGRKPWF